MTQSPIAENAAAWDNVRVRHVPQRSCIGCRTAREKPALLRVVRSPEGRLSLDAGGRAPGRGAYLCPSAACLEAAARRKSFDRAFRAPVTREAVADLAEELSAHLAALPAVGKTA